MKRVLALALLAFSLVWFDSGEAGSAASPMHFVAHLNAAQMARLHPIRGVATRASAAAYGDAGRGDADLHAQLRHLTGTVEHADVMLLVTPRRVVATAFPVCMSPYCQSPTGGDVHWVPSVLSAERRQHRKVVRHDRHGSEPARRDRRGRRSRQVLVHRPRTHAA